MIYAASTRLVGRSLLYRGARPGLMRYVASESNLPASNEERVRAYLDRHGLGTPDASLSKDPTSGALTEDKKSEKRLPTVQGSVPSAVDISALLIHEGGGLDVVDIDVSDKASFTNNLVLCTGHSPAHLHDMATRLVDNLKSRAVTVNGEVASLSQGRSLDWLVVDAGLVVTHFFLDHTRKKYGLEELWLSDITDTLDEDIH